MITISVSMLLAICSGIVVVSAAVGAVVRGINVLRKPEIAQNKNIEKLTEKLNQMEQKVSSDNQRLDDLETGLKYTLEALFALLSHAIDGNETEGLKDAKKHLNDYLIGKVEK